MSKNLAIIFAGGSGARMGTGTPKQFLEVNGKPIIIHTLEYFEDHPRIDEIYIACKEEYIPRLERMAERWWIRKIKKIVPGGETGQDSIFQALSAAKEINDDDAIVLIHDGVRPFITEELIDKVIDCVEQHGAAVTCTPLLETPVISEDGQSVETVPERQNFYTAQAPQAFRLGEIYEAHQKVRETNPNYTGIPDSCALMKSLGKEVSLVEGNRGNIKVTTPEDLYVFRGMLQYRESQDTFGLGQEDVAERLNK